MKKTTWIKLFSSGMAIALLGLSAISSNFQSVSAAESVNYDGNAYVYLDIDQAKLSYSTVIKCDAEQYEGHFGAHASKRTIVGFDSLDDRPIESINRLTMTITYYTYGALDFAHWWPKSNTEDFILKASEEMTYVSQKMSLLTVGGSGGYPATDIYHAAVLPTIGKVATDYMPLEDAVIDANLSDDPSDYTEVAPTFYEKEFYVIMPVERDVRRVWISIDAYTTGGEHISDGLDEFGDAFEDEFGSYIELSDTTAVGAHFTDDATVNMVTVTNVIGTGLTLKFGEFDYHDSTFSTVIQTMRFDESGANMDDVALPFGYDAILILDEDSTATVKVYYTSATPAVYSNITGPDLVPEPGDDTPCTTCECKETWLERICCQFGLDYQVIYNVILAVKWTLVAAVVIVVCSFLFKASKFFSDMKLRRDVRSLKRKK